MPTAHVHDHSRDDVRIYSLPYAVPELAVDLPAVAALYDAAIDDCKACIQERLEPVAADTATAAALVGWACLIMAETHGGFPDDLLAYTSPREHRLQHHGVPLPADVGLRLPDRGRPPRRGGADLGRAPGGLRVGPRPRAGSLHQAVGTHGNGAVAMNEPTFA